MPSPALDIVAVAGTFCPDGVVPSVALDSSRRRRYLFSDGVQRGKI